LGYSLVDDNPLVDEDRELYAQTMRDSVERSIHESEVVVDLGELSESESVVAMFSIPLLARPRPIFIRRSSPRPTISIFKLITIVKTPPHTLPPSPPRVITAADIALEAIVVAPNIAVAVFKVRGHCFRFWMSSCPFFWVSRYSFF